MQEVFANAGCNEIDRWSQRIKPIQTVYPMDQITLSVFCQEDWILIQRNKVHRAFDPIF